MFSLASVCQQGGGIGWCHPSIHWVGEGVSARKGVGITLWSEADNTLPGPETDLPRDQGQTRSTSGQNASYWNAFLFFDMFPGLDQVVDRYESWVRVLVLDGRGYPEPSGTELPKLPGSVWQLSIRDLQGWCIQVQYRNYSVILYEQNYPDFLDLFDSYPPGIYRADAFRYSTGIIV